MAKLDSAFLQVAAFENPFGWIPESWRLPPEIDLWGFYLTPVIFIGLGAVVLGLLTAWVAERLALARFVWHPPLFLVALMFIYGFMLALMFLPK